PVLPLLGEGRCLVMAGDAFTAFDPGRALTIAAQMRAADLSAWCVMIANPAHNPGGDFALRDGLLRLDGAPRLTFRGIGVYRADLFAAIASGEKAPLAPLLRDAAARARAGAEYHGGRWTDVGTPQRLAELDAQLTLEARLRPAVTAACSPPARAPPAGAMPQRGSACFPIRPEDSDSPTRCARTAAASRSRSRRPRSRATATAS